jgi:integrase
MAGRGHIRQRGRKWCYVVSLPPGSAKRQEWGSGFATRDEAERALTARLAQLDQGQGANPSGATLAAYLAGWLERKRGIRDGTQLVYATAIRRHIVPALGAVKLRRLTPEQVETFYLGLLDTWPGALPNVRTVLCQALDQAVRYGHLARNPARLVEVGAGDAPLPRVWTLAEARRFLSAAAASNVGDLYRFLLATGCRFGEAAALGWGDVDLDRRQVTIRQTRTLDRGGKPVVGTAPKTHSGRRSFSIDTTTAAMLTRRRTESDGTLVFGRADGRMPAEATVRFRFLRLIAEAGVPVIRIHDLRHTHATLALADGEDINVVSKRLGHKNVTITYNRYAHVNEAQQEQAAARVERLFG